MKSNTITGCGLALKLWVGLTLLAFGSSAGTQPLANLEWPWPNALFESEVVWIRGWVCRAERVEIRINGGPPQAAAHGIRRADTLEVCGTADTGFSLTLLWYEVGEGVHNLRAFADGVEFANVNFTVAPSAPQTPFNDIPNNYWAREAIEKIRAVGITSGCGNNNYCPLDPVTRAQMAIFLLRGTLLLRRGIHGVDYAPPPATGAAFADVPLGVFADAWIEELARAGITGGCGGGNYCPNAPITRAQMAVFLLRAKHGAGYEPPLATGARFGDVPAAHWAGAWIEQLAQEGITGGCGGGNYCPDASVNRDQMAVFLTRTFNL